MRKRFTEAVPGLKIDAELEDALADVWVESITHSQEMNELKLVVSSSRQIPAAVYSLEGIIRRQLLHDAPITVRILQKVDENQVPPAAAPAPAKNSESISPAEGRAPASVGGRGNGWNGRRRAKKDPDVLYRHDTEGVVTKIEGIEGDMEDVVIEGEVFGLEERETRSGKPFFTFSVTDRTDSIRAKIFSDPEEADNIRAFLKNGAMLRIRAAVAYDSFDRELALTNIKGIKAAELSETIRQDTAPVKRVELHCHTKMSDMDGVSSVSDLLTRAAAWGHQAMAVTDTGIVQAFPDASHTRLPDGFKIIYGMEGYMVDDVKDLVTDEKGQTFDDDYVVFDIETTGLNMRADEIIEIGAVKVSGQKVTDRFSAFVKPTQHISAEITRLTNITDSMVADADPVETVLPEFMRFCEGAVLVAHNASFDTGFIRRECYRQGLPFDFTIADTLSLSRLLLSNLKTHRLDKVSKELGVTLSGHHRAVNDAEATAGIFIKLLEMLQEKGVHTLKDCNALSKGAEGLIKHSRSNHIVILAKNDLGRANLYRLVTQSHLTYFSTIPRIPKSLIEEVREGLIIGSACEAGELYEAVLEQKDDEELKRIASFYDYLEVQPAANASRLIGDIEYDLKGEEDLRENIRRIVELGDACGKPVCATGDVHFLDPEDEMYRRIIMYGLKDKRRQALADHQPPLYLHTTDEMLDEFSFLGKEKAYQIVVENTNMIADMCEPIAPVRPDNAPPVVDDSENKLRSLCYDTLHDWYGDDPPALVTERLEKELNAIISHGFAGLYIIAWELIARSNEDGYLVGSRGSVGSSFVATMAHISEVNPLPPHYRCPECRHSEFDDPECVANAGGAGCDMADKDCPVCGTRMIKDGFDIPFETFLGFTGNKEPDIDLNFADRYLSRAHHMAEEIFGEGHTFRAGTIGTLAEKTAYGYVRHYMDDHGIIKRRCEVDRISAACVGIRRTTGQHPGGIVVLPYGEDIDTFTPLQHPADDVNSDIITTHFEYHSIEQNLLKLDMLGKGDPTMIRMLEDLTGIDAVKDIPLDAPEVLSLFKNTDALGITPDQIGGCRLGVMGIPEFNTDFAMQMLIEAKPDSVADLVRIAGLAHGTDVWSGNTQDLILNGIATLKTAISTRDDIMLYLIKTGLEPAMAFDIMENVRKGKVAGGKCDKWPAYKEAMHANSVPDWYIESCQKIKYMFPKAHAAAYVMMAWRIAWYKIHYPLAFYASYFTIRASGFDYELMCLGRDVLEKNLAIYRARRSGKPVSVPGAEDEEAASGGRFGSEGADTDLDIDQDLAEQGALSQKELLTLRDMRVVQEMYERGLEFAPLDIYKADPEAFTVTDDGRVMPPISSISGMGLKAAEAVARAAKDGEFLSRDDFRERTKVSQTMVDKMNELGLLGSIPENNQLSFFDFLQ